MRRTAVAAAALSAVASLALISPADAAGSADELSGSASCSNGGTITLRTSADAAGTEHGTAVVKGVREARWAGSLVLGPNAQTSDQETAYTAHGGRFSASATQPGAESHDAIGYYFAAGFKNVCVAALQQFGRVLVVSDGNSGLAIRKGAKPVADSTVLSGKPDRYRFDFTVRDGKKVQHARVVRKANRKGRVEVKARSLHHIPSTASVSVKITDLTHRGTPMKFTID